MSEEEFKKYVNIMDKNIHEKLEQKQIKITNKDINELIGIKESFELPDKLMKILLNEEEKDKLLNKFLEYDIDLKYDFLRDYFQEQHSNRNDLKQDYTPDCICEILSRLKKDNNKILDVCSGTGALTISNLYNNKIYVQCEELSSRSIPVLLLNLIIRNVDGLVVQKDVLKNEITTIYKLESTDQFSNIKIVDELQEEKFDIIVSNPPYSLGWEPKYDERFYGYELAPKSKADYAFVLDIVYRLSNNGQAFIILPHGVLFRGASEEKIRKQLIENNLIDSIIGLPDKLFMNTQIPTLILVLNKNKKTNDVLFIDSSKNCIKKSKQNDMNEEHINKIISTYRERKEIEKYSHLASYEEIVENDYNLNIPRYVDTSEEKKLPDLKEVVKDIIEIDNEIEKVNKELKELVEQLEGTNPESKKYYEEAIKPFLEWLV